MSTRHGTARPVWRHPAVILGVVGLALLAAIAATTTVVRGSEPVPGSAEAFDATRYAEEKYDSEVVPAITGNATDIGELLTRVAEDPEATGEELGHRAGAASPYAYAVSGEGVAGKVEGTLLPVEVPGVPDGTEVMLQVGPAINGTALRDATGLIDFSDFLNQIEYANAATELNTKVKENVLAGFDAAAAEGQTVRFTGAFAAGSNPAVVQVTPVELEVLP
ncbi:DUF2291 family protein [Promicromonospora sukumoe]